MDMSYIYHFAYVQDRNTLRSIAQVTFAAKLGAKNSSTLKCVRSVETGEWQWQPPYHSERLMTRMCHTLDPELLLFLITPDGICSIGSLAGQFDEVIDDSRDGPAGRGELRDIQMIGGVPYVVGMSRQVYRRDGPGSWSRQDDGVVTPRGAKVMCGFNAIHGLSEANLYAVGFNGEIWQRLGGQWHQQVQPKWCVLHHVRMVREDLIYACGQLGTLLRSTGSTWEEIPHGVTDKDFWSMAWFNDALYLACDDGVFRLGADDRLVKVDMGQDFEPTCRHLHANDGVLLSVGPKHLMRTEDGETWYPEDPEADEKRALAAQS
ncbi:hypothetical protein [Pseudomonas sp. GD03944]|uniref:WD40/YVTN/BNR-like repeat-containing protein n=1 Tax=Pseudomonas sp. GD03944 TaxID=2975409 RepID=UPI00244CBC3F|nr:hypothetical protein [Pseudomonas sp. GD03944]MDH1263464.1 hypothetical protein [Pseudomonas sp. GD03944]